MQKLPLDGIRVLDITVVWAGPYCTSFLADLGAEVIRVESTAKFPPPPTRGVTPRPSEELIKNIGLAGGGLPDRVPGARPWNRVPAFNAHARNKKSMTVDLLKPDGLEIFKRLVKISDVFVENNPPGTMDKLGISYDMLKEHNPKIIMLRMPAYGSTGPYKDFRGFGLHMESVVGHGLQRGYRDMDPTSNTSVLMADAAGGAQAAFAALAALYHRNRTGEGQLVELPQAENIIPFLGGSFMDYSMNGRNASTIGNRHRDAIQGCYPCLGEDRWVVITIADDSEWRAFIEVLGYPDWAMSEDFTDHISRYRNHDALDEYIAEWTSRWDHREVMELLQSVGVAAGPVLDQKDAYEDPHLNSRGAFEEAYQEDTGTHMYPGAPYKMSESPIQIRRGPVRMGEDNEYVYKTLLQVSDEEYADLERAGHIGMDFQEDVS
ncbi:MAG: CoA transferase [SAR202 cluster bacterium]|jgi:crotonobetainyl-CoA:carnitine CoA-transferase CaiB-like acyl-CoA transferase|nr:CoA transferase [SAR202 cluster bacterium]MDP6511675.1 CoA transferase [SAR202 cluster bacterium]MDP6713903.1 CoA transferase [SAR202 cluster bacterium]